MKFTIRSSHRGILALIIVVSIALHLIVLLAFGAYKFVEKVVRNEPAFDAPPIHMVPQREPEYVVNLDQLKAAERKAHPALSPTGVSEPSLPAFRFDLEPPPASTDASDGPDQ